MAALALRSDKRSYLELLEGQPGVVERIERLRREQIAAEMRVNFVYGDKVEILLFHKDLLSNRIKYSSVQLLEDLVIIIGRP